MAGSGSWLDPFFKINLYRRLTYRGTYSGYQAGGKYCEEELEHTVRYYEDAEVQSIKQPLGNLHIRKEDDGEDAEDVEEVIRKDTPHVRCPYGVLRSRQYGDCVEENYDSLVTLR